MSHQTTVVTAPFDAFRRSDGLDLLEPARPWIVPLAEVLVESMQCLSREPELLLLNEWLSWVRELSASLSTAERSLSGSPLRSTTKFASAVSIKSNRMMARR